MADNTFRNLAGATLKIIDGAGTPNELLIDAIDGGLEFESRKDQHVVMGRSGPLGYATGKKQPTTLSFSISYREWKSKTGAAVAATSPRDFMLGRYTGAASVGDGGDHEFKLELEFADSGATADETETMVWNNCRLLSSSVSEDEETTDLEFEVISLDWEPTVTRS